MRCWAVQSREQLAELLSNGRYRSEPDMVDPDFEAAYRWMAEQMARRIRPSSGGVSLPVWLWVQAQSAARPKPDLRRAGWGKPGAELFLVEFEVPSSLVLPSDHQRWHLVLTQVYLPADDRDERQWESELEELGLDEVTDSLPERLRRRVRQSWSNVFDTSEARAGWDRPEEMEVQGTVWELHLDWLVSARRFIAR